MQLKGGILRKASCKVNILNSHQQDDGPKCAATWLEEQRDATGHQCLHTPALRLQLPPGSLNREPIVI